MNVNFNDLVEALKNNDDVKVASERISKKGTLKENEFRLPPYIITIEYVDFGRSQTPLKFYAQKEGSDEKIFFNSLDEMTELLNIDIDIKNSIFDKVEKKDDYIDNNNLGNTRIIH